MGYFAELIMPQYLVYATVQHKPSQPRKQPQQQQPLKPPFPCCNFPVPGAPKAIKAVVKSPRSIVVSWLPPPDPANGVVERYHIYLRYVVVLTMPSNANNIANIRSTPKPTSCNALVVLFVDCNRSVGGVCRRPFYRAVHKKNVYWTWSNILHRAIAMKKT